MFIPADPTTTPIREGEHWVNRDPRNANPKGGSPLTIRILRPPTLSAPAGVVVTGAPKHLRHLIGRRRSITRHALRANYTHA